MRHRKLSEKLHEETEALKRLYRTKAEHRPQDHGLAALKKKGMAEDSGIFNQVKSTKRPAYINFPNIQNLCHECLKFFHYNNRSQFFVATSAPHKVDASRFWAVVIGIDEYKEISILECGVADAQSFQQYLIADLGVPEGRIQLLLGSKEHDSPTDPMCPSRTCIIDALLSLIDNHEIEKGDNIIFYYAGHGSSYKCSDYRDDEMPDAKISPGNIGYIEALCPIDRDTHDANGEAVPDISDRELNTILKLISRAKGHHITVILDCCYSGGVGRDVPPPEARTCRGTRWATIRDMLHVGEENLRRFGCLSILSQDWEMDCDSHVVLAACKPYQFARERWVDGVQVGVFTH